MTLATKAELRDAVAAWLSRVGESDFLARFDTFLHLAELDFGTKLKTKVNERRQIATLNERWENNPAGNQAIKSIAILGGDAYKSRGPLKFLSYQDAVRIYSQNTAGDVEAYTKVGTQIGFFPFPSEDLTSTLQFEIISYVRPDPLLLDTDSNEILTNYPSVYLYGVLMQAAPYNGREEDLARWRGLYEAAIAEANAEQAGSLSDAMLVRAS